MDNTKKDNLQFRILYAIGIVLVIISHITDGVGISLFHEIFPLFIFNIALFVFCSGYFFKEQNVDRPLLYIWKKFKTLIIPLYLYNIAYGLLLQFLSVNGFTYAHAFDLSKLFIEPLTNGHQFDYNLATWFVAPLFMTQVFYVLFRRITRHLIKHEFIYLILCILIGMFGAYMSEIGVAKNHLVLARLLYFIPFFAIGFYYKNVLEKYDNLSNLKYFAIVVGTKIALILMMGKTFTCSVAWGTYSYIAFAGGILGIAFWLRIARLLTPAIGNSPTIYKVSNSTYSIMANHFLGFTLLNFFYYLGQFFFGWFLHFNQHAFWHNFWYFFYPKQIYVTGLFYVVMGMLIGVWIQDIINWVKQKTNHLDQYLKICALLTLAVVGCAIYIYFAPIVNEVIKQNAI